MERTFSINLRTCGISIGGALAGLGLVQFLRLFFIKMRHMDPARNSLFTDTIGGSCIFSTVELSGVYLDPECYGWLLVSVSTYSTVAGHG